MFSNQYFEIDGQTRTRANCMFVRMSSVMKQGVALTGRNRTGPPAMSATRPPTRSAADPPAHRQRYRRWQTTPTDNDRQRRQTTDANEQNNTGPLGRPVMNVLLVLLSPRMQRNWLSSRHQQTVWQQRKVKTFYVNSLNKYEFQICR